MSNVLVTGGAGFIGSHAAKALARAGHTPVTYDNLSSGYRHNVRYGPFEAGDIRNTPQLSHVLQKYHVEAVLHFAASIEVGFGEENPIAFYKNNLAGTVSLLDAMHICDVRQLVFSSTAAVYGPSDGAAIHEDHPRVPDNVYGRTKKMSEDIISDAARAHGIRFAILRYFNASGADPDGELGEEHEPETHLIPNILRVAAGHADALEIFGCNYDTPDGTCIRDYVHVTDLARAHILSLEAMNKGRTDLICNLGAGKGYSVLQVIEAVEVATGRQVPVVRRPRRSGDSPVLLANPDRAKKELGFECARSTLAQIIADAARFHCQRKPA